MQPLLTEVHELARRWWDPRRALLTTPAGRHDAIEVEAGQLGVLPPTLWWAHGLLRRDEGDDRLLAERAVRSVLERQHDAPGTPWHGSWPAVAEQPTPTTDADAAAEVELSGRVVVGAALALLLRDHRFDDRLAADARAAVERAVRAEPVDRVDPSWTNVAVQLAWLELEVGRWTGDRELLARGGDRAKAIAADTSARGHVAEHVSPTHTGITLLGLSLWAERPPVADLAPLGRALRDEVWHDLLAAWHPGLRTLVPPFTRAYAMDLTEHVGATAPWLAWLVDGTHPLPPLDAPVLHQGHDLPLVFLVDALADAGEDVLELAPLVRAQPARQGLWRDRVGPREWTGWTGGTLAAGAESSPTDWGGWWQVVTAAALWRAGRHNAWLRLHQRTGPVDAGVDEAGGRVVLHQAVTGAPLQLLVGGGEPDEVTPGRLVHGGRVWRLEGVEALEAATTDVPDADAAWRLVPAGERIALTTEDG